MNPSKRKNGRASPLGRPTLPEWLAVKLDMPADLLDGGIRLDLRGRNTLTVHGCTGILEYAPGEIRLALGKCILAVGGERLVCTSYLAGAVGIEGCICSIRFCDGEDAP
jgi:sporulation protein YqfC